jgi:hypothetical protein
MPHPRRPNFFVLLPQLERDCHDHLEGNRLNRYVGSHFHFFNASSATWYRSGGPDTSLISMTLPCSSEIASICAWP